MGLIGLILTLAVVGLIVYLIVTYIPMPEPFKKAIWIIAGVFLLLYLLFGPLGLARFDIPLYAPRG